MLRKFFEHPLTKGLDINDPYTTYLRRQIIQEKAFLREIYKEWYFRILKALPNCEGPILEIGSGSGFMKEYIPNLTTSEIFDCPGVDLELDACQRTPFEDKFFRAIVMTDVFHHLPKPIQFLNEATRILRLNGRIVMIEPWVSSWSRFVYGKLHHEPFEPESLTYDLPRNGPLSEANSALPWMIFKRDKEKFENDFPNLHIIEIKPFMPFRYLVSGGVSLRSFMPMWSFNIWKGVERILQSKMESLAMFAHITLVRIN